MRDVLFYKFLLFVCVYSSPVPKNVKEIATIPNNEQIKFMQKFGYLGGGHEGFEAQYAESAIKDAIVNMQKFGGVPQSGILDENTLQLLTKKRCGVKDIINEHRVKRFSVVTPGWKKREITYFISNWSPKLGQEIVANEVQRALNTWAGYGNLTFIRTDDPSADIVVGFAVRDHGDAFPFDGPGNILAHAFFPNSGYGGDVHFDDDENWSASYSEQSDTTNFFAVAIHELGHSLGLAHSTVQSSIMSPYYKSSPSINLDYDDVMAMYELYVKAQVNDDIRIISRNLNPELTTESDNEVFTFSGNDNDLITANPNAEHTTKRYKTTYEASLCDGKYDTVAVLRGELFVFRANMVWRFQGKGRVMPEYPILLQEAFINIPLNIKKVDAVYEQKNGTIVFVSGTNYWQYISDNAYGPLPLTNFGMNMSEVNKINAMFVWNKNSKTYIFQDDRFWRFDEETNTLDINYPKNMSRWRKIPSNINGAIEWTDHETYFFKGPLFWRFDNTLIMADKHYPLPTLQYWFGCPEEADSFLILKTEDL